MSFASIGLVRPKDKWNLGGVLRAAHCYNAKYVAIENLRAHIKCYQDTTKAYRHIPVTRGDDLFEMVPYGAVPVAVDLVEGAVDLPSFEHPERSFYIFGPEDGTLGSSITDRCPHKVMVPTQFCMNLAATVNVVLYDRLSKGMK